MITGKRTKIALSDNAMMPRLWRFMCPLAIHQLIIEISISDCALKKKVQTLQCRATRESLCANVCVPCTAAETTARALLASFVLKRAFFLQPDHPRRVPTLKSALWSKQLLASEKIHVYSQLCLSRICWDWRYSFDLEKIWLMRG